MKEKIYVFRRERIASFLQTLTGEHVRFTDPKSVHTYLVGVLKKVERAHNALQDEMIIMNLENFHLNLEYQVRYHATARQVIFIHVEGAYAIYKNNSDVDFAIESMEFYKNNTDNCIISIPNVRGQTVWGS